MCPIAACGGHGAPNKGGSDHETAMRAPVTTSDLRACNQGAISFAAELGPIFDFVECSVRGVGGRHKVQLACAAGVPMPL